MYKFDRMEFPRKYPIPGWLKIFVLAMIVFGILMYNCAQDQISREILISNVRISSYSVIHVEVEYSLSSQAAVDRDIWLLLKVYDNKGMVIGSSLFSVKLQAGGKQDMIKILDKLSRRLETNEKPAKATLEIYKRKILS